MTEEEAREWLSSSLDVSRETWTKLERYVALLLEGMTKQNLISASTVPHIWARHIIDSAQLLRYARDADEGVWMDLGSGAGLPGVVIACLSDRPVLMIETRRKRIDFLQYVIDEIGLAHATVLGGRVESASPGAAAVISARAYAPLAQLWASALHLSDAKTIWILPKGRNAQNELEAARPAWQGVFHVEPSITDRESAIIVARGVAPKGRKKGRS